jgi:hypothetical protein
MTRLISFAVVVALLLPGSAAFAQVPGQMPNTLPPAPPVITPPPPVAPAPVPSALAPLPQPSMGIPPNLNRGPVFSGGGGIVRYTGDPAPRKKRWKRHPRPRVSSY